MSRSSPDLTAMLRALVETPSVSSVNRDLDMGNRAVIDLLAAWLEDIGFSVDVMAVTPGGEKANLVARMGSGEDALVLAGHTDTVPYDHGAWHYDPLRLTHADGRLYGLGMSDMKAFFALAIATAGHFATRDLRRPLVILATADEESTMRGARELASMTPALGRYAVIGEPTALKPVRMHKGILMEAIRVQGRSGHSSDPRLGASALEGMYEVIQELLAWREELQHRHRNPSFDVPVPTLNLGRIHGGDNPNRICGECELQVDLRPLPGMDIDDLRKRLRRRVQRALAGSTLTAGFQILFDGVAPMETAAASPLVRSVEKLSGHASGAVAFATEAPFLSDMGMETVILGPGDVAQAHRADEFLAVASIEPYMAILSGLIAEFCT